MTRSLFCCVLAVVATGCTTLDLWDSPDVTIEERPCQLDSDCDNVRFQVTESLRNDPCLVAVRSCDGVRNRCTVGLRARDSDRDNFRDIDCALGRTAFPPFEVDCDDTDANAYPNADLDGDGFVVAGCSAGLPEDCDDARATAYPGASVEACDGVVSACVGATPPARRLVEDSDGDQFAPMDLDPSVCVEVRSATGKLLSIPLTDCDDSDKLVYPDAPDVCDGRNNDCTAAIGVGPDPGEDVDGDGFASPSSLSCDPGLEGGFPNTDCDDVNPKTYPGAPESCDLIVNDCAKRTEGTIARLSEDPDGDGRFAGNAGCIDPVVNIECNNAAYDRFSAFCFPTQETLLGSMIGAVSVVRAGDFNGDGFDELVYLRDDGPVSCPTSDQVTLRYSVAGGTGTLGSSAVICDSVGTTLDAAIADADADPALELVTLGASGVPLAYDVVVSGTVMSLVAKSPMGFVVSGGAFALGRLNGVVAPVIVALEGTSLGYRTLDASGVASAAVEIDAFAGGTTGVAIGDVDSDGVPDVVANVAGSSALSIYRGVAGGTFAVKQTLDVATLLVGATSVTRVVLGDVEGAGDGDVDIVVAGPNLLGILARRGTAFVGVPVGIQANGEPLGIGGIDPSDIAVRDLDADGRSEIVYSVSARDSVGYIDEMGSSIFAQHVFVSDFSGAARIAVGDFDGDMDADFAAYSSPLQQLSRFTSSFVSNVTPAPQAIDRAFDTELVAVGDFDADGLNDLVGASSVPGGEVVVWRSHTRDFLMIDEIVATRMDVGETITGLAVGEVTGDTRPDIVLASEAAGRVSLVRGTPDLTFGAREALPTFDRARSVIVADLDRSGPSELIVSANAGTEGMVAVYSRATPQAAFTRTVVGTGSAACTDVAVGDVDGDQDLDIAVACRTGGLFVFVNPGSIAGTWTRVALDDGTGGVADYSSLDIADIDRDGDRDVIAYRADLSSIAIHLSTAGGLSSAANLVTASAASSTGASVRAMDVDRDGDVDLVVAGSSLGSSIRLLQSVGGARLRFVGSNLLSPDLTSRPFAHAVGDIERDGDGDFVLSSPARHYVYLMRSAGTPWWQH